MKITVVMPAYREKTEQISQAIESILSQTIREFEYIIILDDPDNKEMTKLLQSYAEKDSRISLYVNEKNSGCPYSKDRGIRLANTEYVAVMDADDIAHTERLEKQLQKIEDEKLDLVAGYVTVIDDEGKRLYDMVNLPLNHEQIAKKLQINNCVPHPTWFMKRSMYLELNGYVDLCGCEDYDFLIRAVNAGYRIGILDNIVLDYRLSTQSVSRNNLYKQYLMMQFLQDKYFKHKMKYKNFDEFYNASYTDKKARKYSKASVYFEKAVSEKARHAYMGMLSNLCKSVMSSKEYAGKILKYVMQEL